MIRTKEDYKKECERLEKILNITHVNLNKTEKELTNIRMTCGFFRNAFRQNQDYRKQFVEQTKEEWEPDVYYTKAETPYS